MGALRFILCLYVVGSMSAVYLVWYYYSDSSSTSIVMKQGDLYNERVQCINVTEEKCFNNPIVFADYAKFHEQNVVHKHKGNFLIYTCHHDGHNFCGGYGNRIEGITMALLFAILSNRTFLIDMTHPFDINRLLHPNVIKWNYTGYMDINDMITKEIYIIDDWGLHQNWLPFSGELFNPNVNVIKFHTNLGLSKYFNVFNDKWSQLFHDRFGITKDNNVKIYGCVIQYLFTYDKVVIDAIQKELQELGLIPGLYVSIHFRAYLDAPTHYHPSPDPFLSRGVEIAKNMSKKLNKDFKVYLVTDSHKAKEKANAKYHGWILPSNVKEVHVDKDKQSLFEGFIGVMVNIEVAAKGAAFVRDHRSTFSDLIQSTGKFNKDLVIIVE